MTRAAEVYTAHLQVGRRLRNPFLAVAVLLRNLAIAVVTLGFGYDTDLLAPTWVVLVRKADGTVVRKMQAGRSAGDGEAELACVVADLELLDVDDFRRRYQVDGGDR